LQVREHQQFWIMLQNHFVNLSQKRNDQLNEIQVTRKRKSLNDIYVSENIYNGIAIPLFGHNIVFIAVTRRV